MTDKLDFKDVRNSVIQTGIESIPVVGDALSVYYKLQDEKRFKRIESFYESLEEKIGDLELLVLESKNPDQMIGIIESIHEQIEKSNSENKKEYFINAYINLISFRNDKDFDWDEYFINLLSSLSKIELDVLSTCYHELGADDYQANLLHPFYRFTVHPEYWDIILKLSNNGIFKQTEEILPIDKKETRCSFTHIGLSFCKFILT